VGLYTENFYAIIPIFFPCFLLIYSPYIFNGFYSCMYQVDIFMVSYKPGQRHYPPIT